MSKKPLFVCAIPANDKTTVICIERQDDELMMTELPVVGWLIETEPDTWEQTTRPMTPRGRIDGTWCVITGNAQGQWALDNTGQSWRHKYEWMEAEFLQQIRTGRSRVDEVRDLLIEWNIREPVGRPLHETLKACGFEDGLNGCT